MVPFRIQPDPFRVAVWLLLLLVPCATTTAEEYGSFVGRIAVEWLDDEGQYRDMRLLEEFTYIDSAGKSWTVPKGAVINGASIPRLFWTFVGPPFVGAYRRASVVHDYYCNIRTEPWQAVHRMFYEASRSAGVPEILAKIMYAAVRGGGPRWIQVAVKGFKGTKEYLVVSLKQDFSEESAQELEKWIRSENPSLDELEAKVELHVKSK